MVRLLELLKLPPAILHERQPVDDLYPDNLLAHSQSMIIRVCLVFQPFTAHLHEPVEAFRKVSPTLLEQVDSPLLANVFALVVFYRLLSELSESTRLRLSA